MERNIQKLIELKTATINCHTGDGMEYLLKSIASDGCYTSKNSLQWKRKQMADFLADFETAVAEGNERSQLRLMGLIERVEVELGHLEARHAADLAVYKHFADGEDWKPQSNKTTTVRKPGFDVEALKKRVS